MNIKAFTKKKCTAKKKSKLGRVSATSGLKASTIDPSTPGVENPNKGYEGRTTQNDEQY